MEKNYNKKIVKKIQKKCWQKLFKMVIYERTTQEDITSWNKKNMLVMREANLNINTKITNFFMPKNKQKNKLKKN